MNPNDYRLNAYRKQAAQSKETKESRESNQFQPEPQKAPLVHKPIFEKINSATEKSIASKITEAEEKKSEEQKLLKQAEMAAITGSWYGEKKSGPTKKNIDQTVEAIKSGGLLKVPAPEKSESSNIYKRVAKFLFVIGTDEAAKIIPHLSPEQTEKIIPEIATISYVSKQEAEEVLAEFKSLLDKSREEGGIGTARTILTKAFGEKQADKVLEKTGAQVNFKPFEYLEGLDISRIEMLLTDETMAVKALVLSKLTPKTSAAIITKMPLEEKKEIVLRLAKMKTVMPEVLQQSDKALHEKLLLQNTENFQKLDGRSVLSQILKRMDVQAEEKIIKNISEENPELGADLRRRLFTEEDILNCRNKDLQEILKNLSDEELVYIIAGKNESFRHKILMNISKTRGDIILEDEQLRKPLMKSECEKITSLFFAQLRHAFEEGRLFIEGRDDEIYVE